MLPAIINDAATVSGGQAVTTSLKIADVFDKEHKHVIRDIEKLEKIRKTCNSPFLGHHRMSRKRHSGVKQIKAYLITRNGMMLLTTGFTGAKVMQFKAEAAR